MKNKIKRQGFTLVELVVVLVILAILVGIALPTFMGARGRAYRAEALQAMGDIKAMGWSYRIQHGNETFAGWGGKAGTLLVGGGYLQEAHYRTIGYLSSDEIDTDNFDIRAVVIGEDYPDFIDRPGGGGGECEADYGLCFAIRAEPQVDSAAEAAGCLDVWMVVNHSGGTAITYTHVKPVGG